ncbi:hypothetical protein Defa_18140 [Desulfovibrio sp. TH_2024_36128]|uniref:DUF2730 family protein n=2 Tax=Desulfovibrio falkowii TaxID=3136602 RepID=A0ABQ0E9M0_9BACT
MTVDIFSSSGASLLVLIVQGLFAWALWSLRRAFVRQDDYLLHMQRDTRREAATARRICALEESLRLMPGNGDLAGLHGELSTLRGEIQALSARISGLDRLLERLEHGLERQEDRLHLLPPVSPGALLRRNSAAVSGEKH